MRYNFYCLSWDKKRNKCCHYSFTKDVEESGFDVTCPLCRASGGYTIIYEEHGIVVPLTNTKDNNINIDLGSYKRNCPDGIHKNEYQKLYQDH